jgi:hypothetical protein
MKYFSFFPQASVSFTEANTVVTRSLTSILATVRFADIAGSLTIPYQDYQIQQLERPDHIAQRIYGDVRFTWLVMLPNQRTLHDWPLSDAQLAQHMIYRYGSVEAAQANIAAYLTTDGHQVDAVTYAALSDPGKSTKSAYELEVERNEERRLIKLVTPDLASALETKLKTLLADQDPAE